jgi:NAD kinase
MERLTEQKIVLVKRKTRLDELIARFNTVAQAKFYVEHLGTDFSDYLQENERYSQSLSQAQTILTRLGRVQMIDRSLLSNFLFGDDDIVVAIGQDGLVANTLKYLTEQVLIGVNPDPQRWDGVLLPFEVNDLSTIVIEVLKNKRQIKEITLAKVDLNDGQQLYAVNDFFIGQKTHISARYAIQSGDYEEHQSSSGIIVSTGLGSTGWFTSILAGASGIISRISGSQPSIDVARGFAWNADYLYFSVREPFPSRTSSTDLVFGQITRERPLKILSEMAENGVIFSDGIESDYLVFNSGIEATIAPAEKKGKLVV